MRIIFYKNKKYFLISLIFWLVFCLFSTGQTYLYVLARGLNVEFKEIILQDLPSFTLWILFTPIVIAITDKYQFNSIKAIKRSVFVHLGALILLLAFHSIILSIYYKVLELDKGRTIPQLFIIMFFYSFLFELFLYTAVTSISTAVKYYNKYYKLDKLYSEAKIITFKMQLHPHFLFNALNNVSMLVRQDHKKDAVTMISQLSDLLRHILENKDRNFIPLEEELDLTSKYLFIESKRYEGRFTFKIDIPNGVEKVLVPDLILQPILENAFKHGLANKKSDCQITITVKDETDTIHITIEDNGCGQQNPDNFFLKGKGLKITSDRLKQIYDSKSQLIIDSSPNLFTKVSLIIPKQT